MELGDPKTLANQLFTRARIFDEYNKGSEAAVLMVAAHLLNKSFPSALSVATICEANDMPALALLVIKSSINEVDPITKEKLLDMRENILMNYPNLKEDDEKHL